MVARIRTGILLSLFYDAHRRSAVELPPYAASSCSTHRSHKVSPVGRHLMPMCTLVRFLAAKTGPKTESHLPISLGRANSPRLPGSETPPTPSLLGLGSNQCSLLRGAALTAWLPSVRACPTAEPLLSRGDLIHALYGAFNVCPY